MYPMMGAPPDMPSRAATMEQAGVPVFNDAEEMSEASGLLARQAKCRARARDAHTLPRLAARSSTLISYSRFVRRRIATSRSVAFLQLSAGLDGKAC